MNVRTTVPILKQPFERALHLKEADLSNREHPVNDSSFSGKKAGACVMIGSNLFIATGLNPTDKWIKFTSADNAHLALGEALTSDAKGGGNIELIKASPIGLMDTIIVGDPTKKTEMFLYGAQQGVHLGYGNTLFSYSSVDQTGDPVDLIDLFKDTDNQHYVAVGDRPEATGISTGLAMATDHALRPVIMRWDKTLQQEVSRSCIVTDRDIAPAIYSIGNNTEVTQTTGGESQYNLTKTGSLVALPDFDNNWVWDTPANKEAVLKYTGTKEQFYKFNVHVCYHAANSSAAFDKRAHCKLIEEVSGADIGIIAHEAFGISVSADSSMVSLEVRGYVKAKAGTSVGLYVSSNITTGLVVKDAIFEIAPMQNC